MHIHASNLIAQEFSSPLTKTGKFDLGVSVEHPDCALGGADEEEVVGKGEGGGEGFGVFTLFLELFWDTI